MKGDCDEFVKRCEVCNAETTASLTHLRSHPLTEPPRHFHTISVDHKTMARSLDSEFHYILILVCGLIRFTIAIPVPDTSADTTLRALVARVFTTHSIPFVLKSDNGQPFVSEMSETMAFYAGYRHIRSPSYNPQSNSLAEQDWHLTLPMITFALNTTVHSSTGRTLIFALFGRHPVLIPELEDADLHQPTLAGCEFVDSLALRLRRVWDSVRESAIRVKQEAIDMADRHRQRWMHAHGPGATAGINVGDYVLVRHGSADFAKNRRKHGCPALCRFRVVRVLPAVGAVQIDPAGTETQPYVNMSSSAAGRFDQPGSFVTGVQGGEHDGQVDDGDDVYIVEHIDAARQRKGPWEYRVIWEGHRDRTWETRDTLSTAGEQVQAVMREARNRAEGNQKSTKKASRARKAGANFFTAL
eukprot:6201144-Pleurochrysis_carterae.AAC.2